MESEPSGDVAVYMVWSPQLGAGPQHVPGAASLIDDSRVTHFWDPRAAIGRAYQSMAGTREPVWDLWMLFSTDAVWSGREAPAPAWWEHQLSGLPPERQLDPDRFAEKAAQLLAR